MKSLYFAEGCVNSWYDAENNVIIVRWLNLMTRTHIKDSFEAHLETIQEHRPVAVIADFSDAKGIPFPDVKEWARKALCPEVKKRSVPFTINVLPRNPIARVGVRDWLEIGREFNLNLIEVNTLEDALAFVKQFTTSHKVA